MAPREQVKYDIFEFKVDEGMLEWFRRKFTISQEYSLYTIDKKAHEPYTDESRLVIYQDQLEGGLRFPLDHFVKLFLNRYNIAPEQLYPNSYRIMTGYVELMYREGREPDLTFFLICIV